MVVLFSGRNGDNRNFLLLGQRLPALCPQADKELRKMRRSFKQLAVILSAQTVRIFCCRAWIRNLIALFRLLPKDMPRTQKSKAFSFSVVESTNYMSQIIRSYHVEVI